MRVSIQNTLALLLAAALSTSAHAQTTTTTPIAFAPGRNGMLQAGDVNFYSAEFRLIKF
jgi:hypothetical protein